MIGDTDGLIAAITRHHQELPVIEVFGPTIQGEGPLAGQTSFFVRFGGCDFRCKWCDSLHAVIPEQVRLNSKRMSPQAIADKIITAPVRAQWVTFSGGNPALHDLWVLNDILQQRGHFKTAVETQGTIYRPWIAYVDQIVISPKPPSAGVTRQVPELLDRFIEQLSQGLGERMNGRPVPERNKTMRSPVLKIVVFDEHDFDFARSTHAAWPGLPLYLSVGTYVEGTPLSKELGGRVDTNDDIITRMRWLFELVTSTPGMVDATVFPQLHALAWGQERGR